MDYREKAKEILGIGSGSLVNLIERSLFAAHDAGARSRDVFIADLKKEIEDLGAEIRKLRNA